MAAKYKTKIRRARFVVSPFTGAQMAQVGQEAINSVFARWDRSLDVADQSAPPLSTVSKGYRTAKLRRTGSSVRDLKFTGRLRRSIKVISATENRVTLGPVDGIHSRRKKGANLSFSDVLTINQRRWRMWGLSPSDKELVVRFFRGERPVRAEMVGAA